MVKMLPSMVALMPDLEAQMMDPRMSVLLSQLSLGLIIVLLLHSALVAWVALRMGNLAWILSRVAVYPMVLVMTIIITAISAS